MWVTGCTHWSYAIYHMYKYAIYANFEMPIRKMLCHLTEREVNQVVFCDNSDDEERLTLDDDNLGYLKKI